MGLLDASKLNYAFKKILGRVHTSNTKNYYEENAGILTNIGKTGVWIDDIPATAPATDTASVKVYSGATMLQLTQDTTVANRMAFLAKETVGNLSSNSMLRFIPPTFGQSYSVRLFVGGTAASNEVPSSHASNWIFDYDNGVLVFESAPPAGNVYIKVYQYIGATLSDMVGGSGGFAGDVSVDGFINSTESVITINSDLTTGTPTENASLSVLRGTEPTVNLVLWDETADQIKTSVWNPTTSTMNMEKVLTESDLNNLTSSMNAKIVKGVVGDVTPALTYTITHNLNADYVKVTTYAPGENAGEWVNESFNIVIADNNTIKINLADAKKIKYIIESV